jgi:hypothetical protein
MNGESLTILHSFSNLFIFSKNFINIYFFFNRDNKIKLKKNYRIYDL